MAEHQRSFRAIQMGVRKEGEIKIPQGILGDDGLCRKNSEKFVPFIISKRERLVSRPLLPSSASSI